MSESKAKRTKKAPRKEEVDLAQVSSNELLALIVPIIAPLRLTYPRTDLKPLEQSAVLLNKLQSASVKSEAWVDGRVMIETETHIFIGSWGQFVLARVRYNLRNQRNVAPITATFATA